MNIRIVSGMRQPAEYGNDYDAGWIGSAYQLYPRQGADSVLIEPPAEVDVNVVQYYSKYANSDRLVYRFNSARTTEWWALVKHFRQLNATLRERCTLQEAFGLDLEIIAEHVASVYQAAGIEKPEVIVHFSVDFFSLTGVLR